jgi:hypothetical protein
VDGKVEVDTVGDERLRRRPKADCDDVEQQVVNVASEGKERAR